MIFYIKSGPRYIKSQPRYNKSSARYSKSAPRRKGLFLTSYANHKFHIVLCGRYVYVFSIRLISQCPLSPTNFFAINGYKNLKSRAPFSKGIDSFNSLTGPKLNRFPRTTDNCQTHLRMNLRV